MFYILYAFFALKKHSFRLGLFAKITNCVNTTIGSLSWLKKPTDCQNKGKTHPRGC